MKRTSLVLLIAGICSATFALGLRAQEQKPRIQLLPEQQTTEAPIPAAVAMAFKRGLPFYIAEVTFESPDTVNLTVCAEQIENRPYYEPIRILPVEAQKEKKKEIAGVNSTNTQPISLDATKQKDVEVQTYTETINRVGIEMVRVPGGKFMMGSPADEKDRNSNEGPQHEVTVSSFYVGKFEVTQSQWRAVSVLPKVKIDLASDPAKFKGDNLPVERVSWEEAVEFCERLSKATGKTYRVPTEAEWEYACRAGTTTPFHFGETITPELVNYDGRYPYGAAAKGKYRQKTIEVGSLGGANRFGLYDMHGNVLEWCGDWYSDNYYFQSPATNPTGPSTGLNRVVRGGGWSFDAQDLRSAGRDGNWPGIGLDVLGFRLVRSYN